MDCNDYTDVDEGINEMATSDLLEVEVVHIPRSEWPPRVLKLLMRHTPEYAKA